MNDEMMFQQMKFIRSRTVASLDATPDEVATVIPEGFNNHLLWQYGHIYVSHEILLHSFVKEESKCPPHYLKLFAMGSKPADWGKEEEIPSLEELRTRLVEQPQKIMDTFGGRLGEIGEKPFVLGPETKFTTLGEVLGFAMWHEGLHQGTSDGIKRALGLKELFKIPEKN
ncbi:DinB family protein [Bacillus carboniphilus]|uniref:DinB family protein n=1 Tax=Bacillus carboniphilus TaxID=86663 RepID=A0ABN0WJG9_9BACI